MEDIEALKKLKDEYVDKHANRILDYMKEKGIFETKESTCDFQGWDRKLHTMMPDICKKLETMGVTSSSKLRWDVTDWTFKIK